jgi:hypothetical protein
MVKLFVMIPRDRKVSRQEFHDHWRHPHATLGRDIPAMGDLVQSHQFDSDHLPHDQSYFEGIGEAWFPSVTDAAGMAEDEHYTTYVRPDEVNFIDLGRLEYLFCDEEVVLHRATEADGVSPVNARWTESERPTSIKLIQFMRAGSEPWAQDADRELGLRVGALRQVRGWPCQDVHDEATPWRGVRELWWPTLWDFETGIALDPEAWRELLGTAGGATLTLLAHAERWPPFAP